MSRTRPQPPPADEPAAALARLRRAVTLHPRDAQARLALGLACERLGRVEEAARHHALAATLDPALAAAPFRLGLCQQSLGRSEAAIAGYRSAIALAPDHAEALNNLALLLAGRGETDAAEALLRRALARDPGYAEALNNLAAVRLRGGHAEEAVALFEQAVALKPGDADARANLGAALVRAGRTEAAASALRAALAAAPQAIEPRWLLAEALIAQGDGTAGEAVLREALALQPGNAETALRLAHLLHQSGHFAAAATLYLRAARHGERPGTAWHGLVRGRRIGPADRALMAEMAALAETASLPADERVALLFALGKAHDDLGDYAAAMRHFDAANAAKRALLPRFDRAGHRASIDRLIATFTPALFAARRGWGSDSERPLLIVGMMRSGTTLLERILAAHRDVAAGGELAFWPSAGPLPAPDRAATAASGAAYARELARISADARRVTDKMPHNVYALGAIHLAFPRARVLHCRRAAGDVGLSIYQTLFSSPHDYAYDQGDIVCLCREYERLAAHWRAVLPEGVMCEVQDQTLVGDVEGTARRVVAFCGLDWDAACLRHAGRPGMIRTASAWQARQDVHGGSVGRWRRYAPYLGELAALAD